MVNHNPKHKKGKWNQRERMKIIPNFDDFPFRVRQWTNYWCVLANVEAVTRYHVHDSKISQSVLWEKFESACRARKADPIEKIGLTSFTEQPLSTDEDLAWAEPPHYFPASTFKTFDGFVAVLEKGVDDGEPYIISVPELRFPDGELTGSRHMLTVVGYDDFHFRIFDSTNSIYARYYDAHKLTLRESFAKARQDVTDALLLRPKHK